MSSLLSQSLAAPPVLLSWEDVEYTVPAESPSSPWDKTLLRGITGYVATGEMLAILGPSGAGKTTLLDVLAMRKTHGRARGEVLLNGERMDAKTLRRISGYVQQEDVMHTYITVEETIRFSATLRTPPSVTEQEINERVDSVIQLLGIEHVRHRRIGSAAVRGISGGEKKRCAVAVELATLPSLLFLDEPTTGLDTFTALHLLTVLKSLARRGVAVVLTIHQPRSSIFQLFDRVLLLNSCGEEAFFGPVQDALPFLVETGIAMDYPANPADLLLDAVASLEADEEALLACDVPGADADADAEDGGASRRPANAIAFMVPPPTQGRDIAAAFHSRRLPAVKEELQCRLQRTRESSAARRLSQQHQQQIEDVQGPYFRGLRTQIAVIAARCTLNKMRDPVATVVSGGVALLFAVLIGSIYFQLGHAQGSIRGRMGMLFFVMMNTTFSAIGSLDMFLADRCIYVREHRNGMYSALAYYVGKVIQDVPIGVAINFVFNLIVYVMAGLQPSVKQFLVFDLVCSLVMLSSYAVCLFVSNLSKNHAVANTLASLVLVLFLLPTGGMLVSLESIPAMWRWIKYVSFVRYAFGAIVTNEFAGLEFTCSNDTLPCIRSGTAYAELEGFHVADLWRHIGMVALSTVVYLLLGYWALRKWRSAEDK